MSKRLPIVIDTDGGVDDAADLWWALTSPLVEVVAATTVRGNVRTDAATANICRVLHAAGHDQIPVGVSVAVGPAPELRIPDFIHGADGLGARVRRLVVMSGVIARHGNALSLGEANIDPDQPGAAAFLAEPLAFCRRLGSSLTPSGESPRHDLLATMAAALPVVAGPVLPLAIQMAPGPALGVTIARRILPERATTPNRSSPPVSGPGR